MSNDVVRRDTTARLGLDAGSSTLIIGILERSRMETGKSGPSPKVYLFFRSIRTSVHSGFAHVQQRELRRGPPIARSQPNTWFQPTQVCILLAIATSL